MRQDQDMFAEVTTPDEIEEWKAKLVIATNHALRLKFLRARISKMIGERAKHYQALSQGLAAAARDKSAISLEHWGITPRELAAVQPREKLCDMVDIFIDDVAAELRTEEPA